MLTIKTMMALILVGVMGTAYAMNCTQTTLITPDGRVMICRNCCDENGQCRITCL